MGFEEKSPEQVRNNIKIEGNTLHSLVNGLSYKHGLLEILSLKNLREKTAPLLKGEGQLMVSEVIGNVQTYHQLVENKGALFQAASQFNLLEMVHSKVSPEDGISRYEFDRTQGPACAIACGAGTIYRNYFVKLGQQIGQTANLQVDCLDEIGKYFGNEQGTLWNMENGYALARESGLHYISKKINHLNKQEYEDLKGLLKIGIQWDTEVTINAAQQLVSQIYCSALPIGYSQLSETLWKEFAILILEATYEATFHTALLNTQKTGNNKVFLTLVGGGAFGNKDEWIRDAILKNLNLFSKENLDIQFVSYAGPNAIVKSILSKLSQL